ncbi:MAG: hypothetical protein J5772_03680 [Clostridia bacterium]|nr:hypothetical protein [Clostridia bacterium]MBR5717570.1 hypothetical protein [Clostridia bacterium]
MSQSCNVCGTQNIKFYPVIPDAVMIKCPVCGNYLFTASSGGNNKSIPQNKNKLASYLFYNAIHDEHDLEGVVGGTNFIGTQEEYDHFKTVYVRISHITDDVITNWYPKTFNEKINRILLMLAQRTSVMGAAIELTNEEKMACFFIDRYRADNRSLLDHKAIYSQVDFLKDYMTKNELLSNVAFSSDGRMTCRLAPKGWQRVDELQKDNSRLMQKQVFVAMSFKPEMDPVRAAIKKAIIGCGYEPRIMDEIEHNHQIVPEMLYEIRQARFVIAELTGHNNGAYYEAGYALGLGKDVIHVCKSEQFGTDGHFDVKQVNTVLWDNETELAEKLAKRIKATIE